MISKNLQRGETLGLENTIGKHDISDEIKDTVNSRNRATLQQEEVLCSRPLSRL
jgi:hypothetical protein